MKIQTKAPTEIDFEAEGFMSGLEFHQQVLAPYNTEAQSMQHGSKLFCPCPAHLRDDDADFTVMRQLRAVAGETGDVDITARF
jgi:Glu-tRNA(Gln) amidotransferase subunit E-like FAD-binding protein